ncbi:MAG: ABC transporter permease [Bacteroidota bacterium]
MIYQYLNAAFRFFKKKWALSSLNIVIFGIGIAASVLILRKISYEYSYDKFNVNHENIYRVSHDHYYPYDAYQSSTATSFYPLGQELKEQYPEVKEFAKVTSKITNSTVKVGDNTFREDDVYVINPSFFNVFTIEMINGDTSNVERFDVFLSESLATKLFGETNPVGESLDLWDGNIVRVKGVYKDVPENSHFRYDLLAVTLHDRERNNWQNYGYHTYIVLNDGINSAEFEEKLVSFSKEFSKLSDEQSNVDYRWEIKLQPLTSIHLKSNLDFEHEVNGDLQSVNLLIIIGVFIIIISCFNFVNLTNSMYAKRFSEFFLRKIHGASLANLLKQYAFESFILLLIGLSVGALILFALPYFSGYSINLSSQTEWFYWGLLIIISICLIISVILPSSGFALINPLKFTKGQDSSNSLIKGLGKSLIVVQFIISFILIAGAITINEQLDFIIKKNPGINVSDVVTVDFPGLYYPEQEGDLNKMKFDLEKQAGIQNVSFSGSVPGRGFNNDASFRFVEDPSDKSKLNYLLFVTPEYFDTYELEILEGKVFDGRSDDSLSIVINETMATELGVENYSDLIGRKVVMPYGTVYSDFEIVGIAKDYYHESLKENIVSCAFVSMQYGGYVNKLAIRLNDSDLAARQESIAAVKKTFNDLFTHTFETSLVEENYSGQFNSYADFSNLIKALSVLAIFMAGVGLFGLASNETAKRTKEVAIRKVNGARILDIYVLFLKYFVKLIGLAFIISLPVSLYFVDDWLNNFAVKLEIGAWFIAPQILIITIVGFISISYYLIKAASQNPIIILRNKE